MIIKDKKVVILTILVVAAVLSLLYGIRSARKTWNIWPGKSAAAYSTGSSLSGKNIRTKRRAERTEFTSWKRSPFVSQETKTVSSDMKITLSGVVWHNNEPKALLNGEIIGIGEKIGDYKVTEIKGDSVTLNDGVKDLRLKIKY